MTDSRDFGTPPPLAITAGLRREVQSQFERHHLSRRLGELSRATSTLTDLRQRHGQSAGSTTVRQGALGDPEGNKKRPEILEAMHARESLDKAICKDLETIGQQLPPVEIARRIEECEILAHTTVHIDHEGFLADTSHAVARKLHNLGERILEIWVPGLDLETLLDTVTADVAGQLADDPRDIVRSHDRLGYEPIDPHRLASLVIGAAQHSGISTAQEEVARLRALDQAQTQRLEAARGSVPLWASLGLLPEETALRDAVDQAAETRRELARAELEYRHFTETFLDAFPPLSIYRNIAAALAAHSTLQVESGTFLEADRVYHRRVVPRAVLFHTIGTIRAAFCAAFPLLPKPSLLGLADETADTGAWFPETLDNKTPSWEKPVTAKLAWRHESYRRSLWRFGAMPAPASGLLHEFTRAMDRSGACVVLTECVHHMVRRQWLRASRAALVEGRSWLDPIAFGVHLGALVGLESEGADRWRLQEERENFHDDKCREAYDKLVSMAKDACPPLSLTYLAHKVALAMATVQADTEWRRNVTSTLRDLQAFLEKTYALDPGSGADLGTPGEGDGVADGRNAHALYAQITKVIGAVEHVYLRQVRSGNKSVWRREGLEAVEQAMQVWCKLIGPVPSVHELLERWVCDGVCDKGVTVGRAKSSTVERIQNTSRPRDG